VARDTKPCPYCETQHYEEFVVRELLDRSLTEPGETGRLDDILSTRPLSPRRMRRTPVTTV